MWTMDTEAPVVIREIWGPIQTRVTSGELTYEQALQEYQKGLLDAAGKLGYQPETTGLDDFPTK
jgi:hypothetical protein